MLSYFQRIKKSDSKFLNTLMHAKNYFSANIATKALGFLSIPVLTRLLTTEDYGIVGVFNSYVGIFVVLFTLNIHESIGRYYYENNDDYKSFVGNNLFWIVIFFSLTVLPFLFFKGWLSRVLNLPPYLILLFFPASTVMIVWSIFIQIKSPRLKSKEISIISIVNAYIGFGITVLLSLNMADSRFRAPIYSNIIIGIGVSIYILFSIKKYIHFSMSFDHLKYSLKYSIPLIPYTLSGVILVQFDRIMINSIVGSSQAGLYSFAYSIGMLSDVVSSSLNTAWMPRYFNYMDNKNYQEHDSDMSRMIRIILIISFGLVCFAREIGMVLARKSFHEALVIVPIIVVGYVFYFFSSIYLRNIGYSKKTIYLTIVMLGSGILNIFLNSIFIPQFGYVAGAWTTLLSYLFLAILGWILSKYILKVYTMRLIVIFRPFSIFVFFIFAFILLRYLETKLLFEVLFKITLFAILLLIYRKMKPRLY